MEWGLTKTAIKVRDPTVPYLSNLENCCSIRLAQSRNKTEIEHQVPELSVNALGNGIQLKWNTTEITDAVSMSEGGWYYRGQQIDVELLPFFEETAIVEIAFLLPRMQELINLTYRQHTLARCRHQVRFQLNEPCMWVPGRASTDINSWAPAFLEAMVSGAGPMNCSAFVRFMALGQKVYGYNPLRVYRTVFGCRADFMHEALLKSDCGKEFIELQQDILKNPHTMLGLKTRALAWLTSENQERLQRCTPWWLLDCDNNFEEILETPRSHMFLSGRRTDTYFDDSAAWVAANNLGITRNVENSVQWAIPAKAKKGKRSPQALLNALNS